MLENVQRQNFSSDIILIKMKKKVGIITKFVDKENEKLFVFKAEHDGDYNISSLLRKSNVFFL